MSGRIGRVGIFVAAALFGLHVPQAAMAQQPAGTNGVLLLVDLSDSMNESDGTGQSKLTAAKNALSQLIDGTDPATSVGLRTYQGDCGSVGQLRVPVGAGQRARLRSEVATLRAFGSTPTPDALRAAADDLSSGSGAKTIVLISDGQSTCGDPCTTIVNLRTAGYRVTVNTVGFAVAGTSAEPELQCVARESGGSYSSASNAAQLNTAIRVAATRGSSGFGDLGLRSPISQPACDGSFITVVYSAVIPGRYRSAVAANLAKYRGSSYLLTSTTCPSLTPYKDGNQIYAVYYGPYATLAEACSARPSGAYPRVLATDWPWESYHKC